MQFNTDRIISLVFILLGLVGCLMSGIGFFAGVVGRLVCSRLRLVFSSVGQSFLYDICLCSR